MDCSIFTLYGCVPSGSLAARMCVCYVSSIRSCFSPFIKQHPVLTGCILLVWSGLVQIHSQSQCRVWCVVECWLVWEAARCSLSEVSWQKWSSIVYMDRKWLMFKRRNVSSENKFCLHQLGKEAFRSSESKRQLLLHYVLLPVCEWGQAWLLWLTPALIHLFY